MFSAENIFFSSIIFHFRSGYRQKTATGMTSSWQFVKYKKGHPIVVFGQFSVRKHTFTRNLIQYFTHRTLWNRSWTVQGINELATIRFITREKWQKNIYVFPDSHVIKFDLHIFSVLKIIITCRIWLAKKLTAQCL